MGDNKTFQSGLAEGTDDIKSALLGCGLPDSVKVKALKLIMESDKNYKNSMLLVHIMACLIRSFGEGKDEVKIPPSVLADYWGQIKTKKTFPMVAYQEAEDGSTVAIKW